MGTNDFFTSITKYFIIITFFFVAAYYAVNFTFEAILLQVDLKLQNNINEGLSLEKLKREIIFAAEHGGITEEDKEILAKSLATIYKRDILPLFKDF